MSHINKEKNDRGDIPSHEFEKKAKKQPRTPRLMRGTRTMSLVFTLLATFIGSNIAIYAASTYYNLDTGEVVVDNIQRVTNAIRATGGLIVGGDPDQNLAGGNTFEVASGNILFSTAGTTQIDGRVGIGGAAHGSHQLNVTGTLNVTSGGSFGGTVSGLPATQPSEFVTLSQLTVGGDGGVGIDIGVMSLNGLQGVLSITGESGVIGVNASESTIALNIENQGIDTDKLADNAVETAKILNGAVTADKLATDSVTNVKIADGAVNADKLASNSVTNAKIQNGAVTTDKILDANVTNAKLQHSSITLTGADGIKIGGTLNGTSVVNLGESITIGVDAATIAGQFFQQGGNNFNATAVLGTTGNHDLEFVTNGTTRMTIASGGAISTAGAFTSGGAFTASGTSTFADAATFNNGIVLASGNRTINASGGDLLLSSSTGRVNLGNTNNFIDGNNLTIAGNFAMSGLTITESGGRVTLTATGDEMTLDANVTVDGQLLVGGGYDLSQDSVIRQVLPIFKYEIPVQCDGSCGTAPVSISNSLAYNVGGAAKTGSTREYRVTVRYAGGNSGNLAWDVFDGSTSTDSFTTPATADTSTESVYTSDPITLPSSGTWSLRVQKPSGGTAIQVSEVFLTIIDRIN